MPTKKQTDWERFFHSEEEWNKLGTANQLMRMISTKRRKEPKVNSSYDEEFQRFHANHPEVYKNLVAMAREVKQRGYKKYSIKTLWCVLRWQIHLNQESKPYKLPDQHHSRYARHIMTTEPDLKDFFNTRELRS